MKSDCALKKGGENMAKKMDFLGKLKALEKDFENVQKMREEASRLAKKATVRNFLPKTDFYSL